METQTNWLSVVVDVQRSNAQTEMDWEYAEKNSDIKRFVYFIDSNVDKYLFSIVRAWDVLDIISMNRCTLNYSILLITITCNY